MAKVVSTRGVVAAELDRVTRDRFRLTDVVAGPLVHGPAVGRVRLGYVFPGAQVAVHAVCGGSVRDRRMGLDIRMRGLAERGVGGDWFGVCPVVGVGWMFRSYQDGGGVGGWDTTPVPGFLFGRTFWFDSVMWLWVTGSPRNIYRHKQFLVACVVCGGLVVPWRIAGNGVCLECVSQDRGKGIKVGTGCDIMVSDGGNTDRSEEKIL